jgi:GT2 family glycosyltransferase
MITASIVTYKNHPDVLTRTIESYLCATHDEKLYVIDNSPTEATRNLCNHPRIEYIQNPVNIGYGRAHNIALSQAVEKSAYHLVLNPDVYFDPHVIAELLAFMEKNHDVGLVMPRVLYPDGRLQTLCKLLPEPRQLFTRRFLPVPKKVLDHINYEYEMRFTNYDEIAEAPFLSGCFMLLRTAALKKAGLFDENFFLYFEDVDLSRRIHKYYKTIYYPKVSIRHIHERGSHKEFKLFWHSLESAVRYFNKWGWFSDPERETTNQKILIRYKVNGYQKKLSAGHIYQIKKSTE